MLVTCFTPCESLCLPLAYGHCVIALEQAVRAAGYTLIKLGEKWVASKLRPVRVSPCFELTLEYLATDITHITLSAMKPGFGPVEVKHLRKELQSLRARVEEAGLNSWRPI